MIVYYLYSIFKDGREGVLANLRQKNMFINFYTFFRVTLFSHLGWKTEDEGSELSLNIKFENYCEIVISSLMYI